MGRRDPRRPKDYPILEDYEPTRFMEEGSRYDEELADYAVNFIEFLPHTQGVWDGKRFWLLPWQERIIRDIFGTVKEDGTRQFKTAYIEIPKKNQHGSRMRGRIRANPSNCWEALKPRGLQRRDETCPGANAGKFLGYCMSNQQPSPPQGKVQRLSGFGVGASAPKRWAPRTGDDIVCSSGKAGSGLSAGLA